MFKKLFQHILLFYFSFMLILASIGIPFAKHTCHVSQKTSYNVLSFQGHCATDNTISCHKEHLDKLKASCCDLEIGILNLNVNLNKGEIVGFTPNLASSLASSFKFKTFILTQVHFVSRPIIYSPPLQILLQVFRC